jgi:hypothetical protein
MSPQGWSQEKQKARREVQATPPNVWPYVREIPLNNTLCSLDMGWKGRLSRRQAEMSDYARLNRDRPVGKITP